jgi:hypothetical protein
MKKLILSAAIVLGSLSSFATTQNPFTDIAIFKVAQEEYKEISLDQVPEAIKTALTKAYPDAVIDKAYVSETKEYKLEITNGEQKGSLFADEKGNWIQK